MSSIRLFISHSERDKELVAPLYNWLQCGLGLDDVEIRCTSVDNIATGSAAIDRLRDDVEAADAVVGLLTSNSLRSHWVGMEMGASWLKQRLFPVRGPGVKPRDLPAPLPSFTTVGYCEKQRMNRLLQDLATLLQKQINPEADLDLNKMVEKAEDFMRRQVKGWFELPPILSAWRLDEANFVAPMIATLDDLLIEDEDDEEVKECVEASGLIVRDPDILPAWARDHWNLSKLTVNHLLTGSESFVQIPRILDEKLNRELRRAWDSTGRKRGKMLREWMQDASLHLVQNLPLEARGH